MQFADPRTGFIFKLVFGNGKAKEVLAELADLFLNEIGKRTD